MLQFFRLKKLNRNKSSTAVYVDVRSCFRHLLLLLLQLLLLLMMLLLLLHYCWLVLLGVFFFSFQLSMAKAVQYEYDGCCENSKKSSGYEC